MMCHIYLHYIIGINASAACHSSLQCCPLVNDSFPMNPGAKYHIKTTKDSSIALVNIKIIFSNIKTHSTITSVKKPIWEVLNRALFYK